MAYRIRAGESVAAAIRRIAREQIDSAIHEIDDPKLDRNVVVHQVRKRTKKIRSLIRLVRPRLNDTGPGENAWYRDAARHLSRVRDAEALIATFDNLVIRSGRGLERDAFAAIRRQLTERRKTEAADEAGLRARLHQFRERLREGRDRVETWQFNDDGFDAVAEGLRRTYARGRGAMRRAYRNPGDGRFHEWRKRVKDHWCHVRLLRNIWKGPLQARSNEAEALSNCLGDDHDLSIWRETLLDRPDEFGAERTIQTMLGLISQRQVELRSTARPLGARLFAEKPKQFARRLGTYWDVQRCEAQAEPRLTHKPDLATA